MNAYFELETPDSFDGWTPLAALLDPDTLRARVAVTHAALGDGPLRAAASVDFLGVTSRVLSPVLAAHVRAGRAPLLDPGTVWWQAAVPGPMRLAFTATSTTDSLAAAVAGVLEPLVEVYADTFALSRQVLRGNIDSALVGAEVALGVRAPGYVRTTCCLLYRFAGTGKCGDCVLR